TGYSHLKKSTLYITKIEKDGFVITDVCYDHLGRTYAAQIKKAMPEAQTTINALTEIFQTAETQNETDGGFSELAHGADFAETFLKEFTENGRLVKADENEWQDVATSVYTAAGGVVVKVMNYGQDVENGHTRNRFTAYLKCDGVYIRVYFVSRVLSQKAA
nr:hypothetical protein [Pyrinomonadaceae bacterium]